MCCDTHALRDALEEPGSLARLLAPGEDWRCRCAHPGARCERRADAEDLLCAWCRVTDHQDWWGRRTRYGGGRTSSYGEYKPADVLSLGSPAAAVAEAARAWEAEFPQS
jgi:hypothetical protein